MFSKAVLIIGLTGESSYVERELVFTLTLARAPPPSLRVRKKKRSGSVWFMVPTACHRD